MLFGKCQIKAVYMLINAIKYLLNCICFLFHCMVYIMCVTDRQLEGITQLGDVTMWLPGTVQLSSFYLVSTSHAFPIVE